MDHMETVMNRKQWVKPEILDRSSMKHAQAGKLVRVVETVITLDGVLVSVGPQS